MIGEVLGGELPPTPALDMDMRLWMALLLSLSCIGNLIAPAGGLCVRWWSREGGLEGAPGVRPDMERAGFCTAII